MSVLKYSRQREAIKTFLAGRTDHPTADIVYTNLRKEYPNISLGTVYRNLALLSDLGEITRIPTGTGADHYDAIVEPHHHFICNHCHQIYDLQMPNIDSVMELARENFPGKIESYRVNFYGICQHCTNKENKASE